MSIGRCTRSGRSPRRNLRLLAAGALWIAALGSLAARQAEAFYPVPWGRPCKWHKWTGPPGWGYGHPGASFGLMHWRMHRYLGWDAFWDGHPGYEISGMRWDWDDGSNAGRGPGFVGPGGRVTDDRPLDQMPGHSSPAKTAPTPAGPTIPQAGVLDVKVPLHARVFVNGEPTRILGTQRQFVASHLAPGQRYGYEIRAEYMRDGRTVKETRHVSLGAGENVALEFGAPGGTLVKERVPQRTTLTLHVPEDAKVYLAGVATRATGATRTFATTDLPPGCEYQDYEVRVELQRQGKLVSRQQTIRLESGQSRELTIDIDASSPELAAR